MKDLKTSLINFNSITEKLYSAINKYDNDSKINNVEEYTGATNATVNFTTS